MGPKSPKLVIYMTPTGLVNGGEVSSDAILDLPKNELKTLYGFYHGRIVFLDPELWVSSADLTKAQVNDIDLLITRHFFIPWEFIGGASDVESISTAAGTIVFPRERELVVVTQALD